MYKVEGYEFETKKQAELAQKEAEGVHYIKNQTVMKDPELVLDLYNKLVTREVFVTPIGIGFLRELQEYLHTTPYIRKESIMPIPVYRPEPVAEENPKEERKIQQQAKKRMEEKAKVVRQDQRRKNRDYKMLFHVSTFFAVIFAAGIVGMFVITFLSGNNVNIMNYESSVIDKYETWESELQEREQRILERERELEEQEGAR